MEMKILSEVCLSKSPVSENVNVRCVIGNAVERKIVYHIQATQLK